MKALLAGTIAFLAPIGAATDLWVGPAGSGLPFTEIQAAVDSAAPGDRIYVLAGTYGPVTIDRELQLSGEGSGFARIVGFADDTGAGQPALTVENVGPPGRVWINGFELAVDDTATTPSPVLARFSNVSGAIELCDLRVTRDRLDATTPGGQGAYLSFADCPRVFGSDVRVASFATDQVASGPLEPFAALRATNSTLSFSDSRFDAAQTPEAQAGIELGGAPAIALESSSLTLGLAMVRGGHRGDQGSDENVRAGDGIRAIDSQVRVHGGRSNLIVGGGVNHAAGPGVAATGAAIRLDETSSLVYGASVELSGGQDTNMQFGPAIVAESGAIVDARSDRLPVMWVASPIGQLNSFHPVFLEGDVGAVHLWWLALRTQPGLELPGLDGVWWLGTDFLIPNPAVVIPDSGIALDTAFISNSPGLHGLALCYQSLELDGTNVQIAPPWFASLELP